MAACTAVSSAILLLAALPHGEASAGIARGGAPHRIDVAVIGDSLSWEATSSIKRALSGARFSPEVSRNPGHALSTPWAQRAVEGDLSPRKAHVIVVETASNDAERVADSTVPLPQYANFVDQLIAKTGQKCLVLMNAKVAVDPIYYPAIDALAVNQVLDQAATGHPNVRIVDWNGIAQEHSSWFAADSLHLTPGLPHAAIADDPPSPAVQNPADQAFAGALLHGIESCPSVARESAG